MRSLALLLLVVVSVGCAAVTSRDSDPGEPKAAAVAVAAGSASAVAPELRVLRTDDFELAGDGSATAWKKAKWTMLARRGSGERDEVTRFKILYSGAGIYLLMDGRDRELTATFTRDFEDLWTEDVFEAFFWTDERWPLYFEYEISPLDRELPILIPNLDGEFLGWRPWHYDGKRQTRTATAVRGGEKKSGAAIDGWSAEVFIPFELLKPLRNVPPRAGTRWRANFYRVDYDGGESVAWDWARVGPSFHDFEKFGTLVFD